MRLTAADYEGLLDNENVQRALHTIREAEGTNRRANPYAVGFGFREIDDLSQHPGVSSSFTQTDGRRNRTTAAGAYQHLSKTWESQRTQLGLPDFSPRSQDIAAVALIDQAGALDNVLKGDVRGFARKVGGTWASMPSSRYAQPKKSQAFIDNAWSSYAKAQPKNVPAPTARPNGILSDPSVIAASRVPTGLLATQPATKGARVSNNGLLAEARPRTGNIPTPTSREMASLRPTMADRFAGPPLSVGWAQGPAPQATLDRYASTRPGASRTPPASAVAGILGISLAAASELPAGARPNTTGMAGILGSPRAAIPGGLLDGPAPQLNVPTPTAAPRPAPITTTRVIADSPRVAQPQRTAVATPTARPTQAATQTTPSRSYAPQAAPTATPVDDRRKERSRTAGQIAGGVLGGAVAGPVGGLLGSAVGGRIAGGAQTGERSPYDAPSRNLAQMGILGGSTLLGAAIGGPIGGLLGGYVGNRLVTNGVGNGGYAGNLPSAPGRVTERQARELERSLAERRSGGEGPSMSRETRDSISSGRAGGGLF